VGECDLLGRERIGEESHRARILVVETSGTSASARIV
jgi:hypothetical protein